MWDHFTRFLGTVTDHLKLAGSSSTIDNCLYLTHSVVLCLPELVLFFILLCYYNSLSNSVLHSFLYQPGNQMLSAN